MYNITNEYQTHIGGDNDQGRLTEIVKMVTL